MQITFCSLSFGWLLICTVLCSHVKASKLQRQHLNNKKGGGGGGGGGGSRLLEDSYTNETWTQSSAPSSSYQSWNSITSDSSGQYLAAVADEYEANTLIGGGIWISSDYGSTWTQSSSAPSYYDWTGITSDSSGRYLAAVAHDANGEGGIWLSTDYGSSWIQSSDAYLFDWTTITSDSSGQHLAAGTGDYGGGIWISTDFGSTWTHSSAPSSSDYYWNSITSDSSGHYLAAVTNSAYGVGGIWLSSDNGTNWNQSSSAPADLDWYSITSDSSGQYLAAVTGYGVGGGIWISSDYGSFWNQSLSAPDQYWYSITSDSSGQYLAAVTSGIWLSSDYGSTWTLSASAPPDLGWYSITSDSSGQYLAAGSYDGGIWLSNCQNTLCGCCHFGLTYCAADGVCDSCSTVAYTVCPLGLETSTGQCCASGSSQCPSGASSTGGWDTSTGSCSCGINQVTCGSACCAAGSEYCESTAASICSSCSTSSPSSSSSFCALGYDPDTDQCCAYNQSDCKPGYSYENYTGLCSLCPSDEFQCSNGVTATCCSSATYSSTDYEYCNTATATCAACSSVSSTFCPTGYASTSSDACCASSTGDCPAGTSLESTTQLCSASQQCLFDSDCGSITSYCEYGSCLQCINQATCEVGEYCDYDAQCQSCSYPLVYPGHYTSAADSTVSQSEASSCLGIFLDVPLWIILTMTAVVVVGIIAAVCSSVDTFTTNAQVLLALYYLTGIPALDVLTDSIYLLTNIIYNKEIFVLVILIIFLSAALFLHTLYDLCAHPKWYILTPPSSVYPIDVSSHLATIEVSSLVRYCSTALLAYCRICFAVVKLSPWLLANAGLLLPLFAIGTFLYSTKLLTLSGPRLWFFGLWIGTSDNFCSEEKGPFNFYAYNTSYYTIIKYQTIPQVLLLLVNQILVNNWTSTAALSISISLFMLVNSVWKFLYLRIVKDLEYSDFPVEVPFLGSLVLQGEELVLVPRLIRTQQLQEPLQPRQPEEWKLQHMGDLDVLDDSSGRNSSIQLLGQGEGQGQGQGQRQLSKSSSLSAPIDNPMLVGQVRQKAHMTVEEVEVEMGTETETGS